MNKKLASQHIFILLHGAWHASWCWKYVTPLLQQADNFVIEHDFLGHGINVKDFRRISLKSYTKELVKLVLSQSKPVRLVAHSFAGVIASQVAEEIPNSIEQLIYIAGVVPEHNHSLMHEFGFSKSGLDDFCHADRIKNEMRFDLSHPEKVKNLFYQKASQTDFDFAFKHIQAEPLLPMHQNVKLTQENFGQVEKKYIACLEDNIINVKHQLRMANQANIKNIVKIQSDHSPFFSMPKDLVLAIKA